MSKSIRELSLEWFFEKDKAEELNKQFEEGIELFAKFYRDLWI